MTNQSNISGNQNIIIQSVSDTTISLIINGDIEEIRNDLAELKLLLQQRNVQTLQYAEKIYNIAHIDEANFGFVTGKIAFNEKLTKQLIDAIQPYSSAALELLNSTEGTPEWQSQTRFSDRAKQIISCAFVGVVGIQLRKLVAIGKEDNSVAKQRDYISKCVDIVKYCLSLLSVSLLSKLWDEHRIQPRSFSETELKALKSYFYNIIEPSLLERFNFLQTLDGIFANKVNNLPIPLQEWPDFSPALTSNSDFHQICQKISNINERVEKMQYNLVDCFEAEQQLGAFFKFLPFLANYSMSSIRHIGYRQPRNMDASYLHRFTALGIHNKDVNVEKVDCTDKTVHTDAVLLHRGNHYQDYINLSPFVIDFNALCFEKGAKICFYAYKSFENSNLEYVFLEDNSIVQLEKKGIMNETNLNDIMMLEEKQKILNLDNMIDLFQEARCCLLGEKY